eukprot:5786227-Pyramimonas_sp.AAC.1
MHNHPPSNSACTFRERGVLKSWLTRVIYTPPPSPDAQENELEGARVCTSVVERKTLHCSAGDGKVPQVTRLRDSRSPKTLSHSRYGAAPVEGPASLDT